MKRKLQEVRVRSGISMAELARRSGVSPKTLQRMENGQGAARQENQWRVYNALRKSKEIEQLPPFEELFGA